MELTEERIQRYSRHILLPEVGGVGQRKLLASSVLIAHEGVTAGVAAAAAIYLAAAGVGRIGWWPLSPGLHASVTGSLDGLLRLYDEGDAEASVSALNSDVRLDVLGTDGEGAEAYELLVLAGEGAESEAAARRFDLQGKLVVRGVLRGWAGIVAGKEKESAFQEFLLEVSTTGDGEVLPPAPAEGALGAMLAASVLRALLGGGSPVGSTVQARFDLSRGRIAAVR